MKKQAKQNAKRKGVTKRGTNVSSGKIDPKKIKHFRDVAYNPRTMKKEIVYVPMLAYTDK